MPAENISSSSRLRHPHYQSDAINMIRPSDVELSAGSGSLGCAGSDIWDTLCAAITGDAVQLKALLDREPKLARAEYWYTFPLHYAVREGHLAAVKVLLAAGANPTAVRYGGEELTIVARDRGHEEVAQLIESAQQRVLGGQPVDHEIHSAINDSDTERVRALLTAQPELANSRDAMGRAPLHLAVITGSQEIAGLLIDHGADTEATTGGTNTYLPSGFTPIDMAIWDSDFWIGVRGNWDTVAYLLERGANYSIPIAAARNDRARIEEILAADEAQIDTAQVNGRRALSCAVQFRHVELTKWFLEKGADPNLPEGRYAPYGTALYFAARDKQYELVSLLLEHGANPNGSIDSCGLVWHVADSEIRLQLYRYGLIVNEVDLDNVDALALWADKDPLGLGCSGCGSVFTMVVCNEWEGNPNALTDERKEALLHMLLAKGVRVPPVVTGCKSYLWQKPKFTRVLLEHGMDPNLPNWQWVTPLHSICELGGRGKPDPNRLELAALFLEFGADINARDEEYRSTPLGWAARSGLLDMVEFLLARDAAPQLPDDEPWATPLAWAEKRGHSEIVALLQRHMGEA